MTMECFPRGGMKPGVKRLNAYFNTSFEGNFKPKKRKTRTKEKNDNTIEETNILVTSADRLSQMMLYDGMILLGRISKVTQYDLTVSLPGGFLGSVQATDLCQSYTNLLRNIIEKKRETIQSNEFKPLSDLYKPGDYITCCIKKEMFDYKSFCHLSMEPQLINQNVHTNYLAKDTKVLCTIKNIEDHGYTIDTGISNVRAFLATEDVEKGKQYFPGIQLLCAIKEIKTIDHTSVIKLSTKKKKINSVNTHDIVSLDVLTPGTKLSLYITKVLSNGLQVTFGKESVGFINRIYLNNPLSTYVENTEITGMLLYILPTVKLAYFSQLTDTSEKEKLRIGTIIEKGRVLYRVSNGIVFKLPESGLHGYISFRRTEVPFTKISTVFKEGSTHKCRIIEYNWMEHLYICTTEEKMLKEKYFSIYDLNIGDILTVTVTGISSFNSIHVQIGRIHGIVQSNHVTDENIDLFLKRLKVGDSVEVRVLHKDESTNQVLFTLKQSLVKSKLPILCANSEVIRGSKYHGTIIFKKFNGLVVQFYGLAEGWLPHSSLDSDMNIANVNFSDFFIGQTILVCVTSVTRNRSGRLCMRLKYFTEEKLVLESVNFSIGEMIEGMVTASSIEGIHVQIQREDKNVTGFLPAGHLAPCIEIGSLLASKYFYGDIISAFVFATEPSLILSRTFVPQMQHRSLNSLKVGDCIPCTIKEILENGVKVIMPIENYAKVNYISCKHISNFEQLYIYQILFVKITAINAQKKLLSLTMLLKDVWDGPSEYELKMMESVDMLSVYLSKLLELTKKITRLYPISSANLGQKVTGTVKKITEYGLVLQLHNKLIGTVRKDHCYGNPQLGEEVFGTILWKDYVHDLVDVSLLPRIINSISSKQKMLPELPTEIALKAEILMVTKWLILVLVKRNGMGYLAALPVRRHANDSSPDLTPYKIYAKTRVYVIMKANEFDADIPICMLKSAFETRNNRIETESTIKNKQLKKKKVSEPHDVDLKNSPKKALKEVPKEEKTSNKRKKNEIKEKESRIKDINENSESEESIDEDAVDEDAVDEDAVDEDPVDEDSVDEDSVDEDSVDEDSVDEDSVDEDSVDEDSVDESETEENKSAERLCVPECGFSWDDKTKLAASANIETSSDDEEESEEESKRKKKKKKLSAAERREQERQKEREIRQREEALASNQAPNSIDQFERLVLLRPDNSFVWLQYMTYHLQATEIDKARAVARRAIKTINFREENERLNIWNVWMNLESRYGTAESLNDVFQEAVRTNDAYKVYMQMLIVHADAGRKAELEKLIGTVIGKFKQDPQMWIDCGTALLKIGMKEKSRQIMQRALQSLPASQHVNLLVRFANLENKLGDKERAQTLFENILSSYPKRVDVWSCYIDCLIKSESIDSARKVLEQACVQTLPPRKMKTLFTKFINFEEKYGTPETVARVRQMAVDYVEKKHVL